MPTTFQGADVVVRIPDEQITDRAIAPTAAIDPSKMAQRVLQSFPVPLTAARVHDNWASNLPSSASADDLGLVSGTWGTDSPTISAGDLKAAGATTRYASFAIPVPANYDSGETLTLRVAAAVETTVADTSCTLDAEAYTVDGDGTVTGDEVTTSAQSINSLTADDYDFSLDAAAILPGDLLLVRLAIACNDAATGTAVEPTIYSVTLLADTRGG